VVTQIYNLETLESTTVEFPALCSLCNSARKYHYVCCTQLFAVNSSSPLQEPTVDLRRHNAKRVHDINASSVYHPYT